MAVNLRTHGTLEVFALPDDIARGDAGITRELAHVRTLGRAAPMEFQFLDFYSGCMAFTDRDGITGLVLVTDFGNSAVHVIDVVHGTHVGYVAAPGTIMSPSGVATRNSLAAVSFCETAEAIRVFENSDGIGESTWTPVRVIAHHGLDCPYGLRFTADGLRLVRAKTVGKYLVPNFCSWYQIKKMSHPSNIWCSDPKTVGNPWKNLIKFYGICSVQMNPAPTPEINVGANSHPPPSQMVPECSSTRRVRLDGSCCFVSHPTLQQSSVFYSFMVPSIRPGW